MRALALCALLAASCASESRPREPFRCQPSAHVVQAGQTSATFECGPGTVVRIGAVGDGAKRLSIVICDCAAAPPEADAFPPRDMAPPHDAGRRDAFDDGDRHHWKRAR